MVQNGEIISTGYNGAPSGEPQCDEIGCVVVNSHCIRAIHAETNAIAQAAKRGVATAGSVLYTYDSIHFATRKSEPCHNCLLVALAAGVTHIYHTSILGEIINTWDVKSLFRTRVEEGSGG